MTRKPFILITSVLVGLTTAHVHADNARGFFVGANLGGVMADDLMNVDPADEEEGLNLGTIEVVAGYKYNGYVGVDVRLGSGFTDKDVRISDTQQIQYSIDSYNAVYYRLESINDKARFYALLGYSDVTSTAKLLNNDDDELESIESSESGASAGFGAGWFLENNLNVNVEIRALLVTEDITMPTATLGLEYRF